MGRIEKTVFISYRRATARWAALAVFQNLTQHGYDVFIDYDGIASGNFETAILENIRARAHFLVLLTPAALQGSCDPKDWMRREIEAAIDNKRNIVPVMLEGFKFDTPDVARQLTGKLRGFEKYNGLEIPEAFFKEAMERLRNKFLNVLVDAVLHSASASAQQAATEQKDKAAKELAGVERHFRSAQAASAVSVSLKQYLKFRPLGAIRVPKGVDPMKWFERECDRALLRHKEMEDLIETMRGVLGGALLGPVILAHGINGEAKYNLSYYTRPAKSRDPHFVVVAGSRDHSSQDVKTDNGSDAQIVKEKAEARIGHNVHENRFGSIR
jgi:hypothetical protein